MTKTKQRIIDEKFHAAVCDGCSCALDIAEGHDCCYYKCPRGSMIHIGENGDDSHWICFYHFDMWHAQRTRFLAAGLPCEMEEL
jgi:hypothetical protein